MAEYPMPRFHFRVDWGTRKFSFTEVTGLDMQVEAIEYRHSDSPDFSKIKLPGMRKYSNITLKRGKFKDDKGFDDWLKDVYDQSKPRRTVTISLLDETHQPVATWVASNCFPVKITAGDLKSDANEIAIESIEIAHEGLKLQ